MLTSIKPSNKKQSILIEPSTIFSKSITNLDKWRAIFNLHLWLTHNGQFLSTPFIEFNMRKKSQAYQFHRRVPFCYRKVFSSEIVIVLSIWCVEKSL